ncbi:MAG: DegT/DnrJ/EryC1/StrS family aminotransferase [Candidatus Poribacteria bacterium]|nr:DegT/DnrJ/EryC1/StrS family aminotransferase [Candidatus Poribacteria bacterium]
MASDWPFEFPGTYWIDEQEERAVLDVLRNGSLFRYYGLGEPSYVDKLEEQACRFYGVKHTLAVNSGTGALITCLTTLGIGPGSEVIIPAFMWVATVGAVVQVGAIPVLCEVDDSFSMSPADLERQITPRTKLILPIHMAGAPCDIESIIKIADKHGIPVLEDCAQCNGGEFRGRKVGTFGKMGMFSLQLNKNMTCGEGGLIVTDDEKLYTRAFTSHDMGLVRVEGRLDTPDPYAILWGGGRRMPELSGAVASVQISKLPRIIDNMRGAKRRIKEMLEDIPDLGFRRLNDPDGDTGPFLILVLDDEDKAAGAAKKLIDAGLHNVFQISEYGLHIYFNIPSLVGKIGVTGAGDPWALVENRESVYDYNQGACPESDALFGRSVLVPIPSKLTSAQEKFAAEAIRNAVS